MSEQKIVLVTGCSTGIGLKTAVKLAKDESKRFKVYATMRSLEKKGALEEEGGDSLGKTLFVEQLDVSKDDSITNAVDKIVAKEGKIDILVNNAGIGRYGPAELETDEALQSVFATNVFGPIKLTRKLLPSWKEKESGHVLTVTSVAGLIGMAFASTYAATKFAVEGHHEALAMELIPFENVNATLIEPGPVATPFAHNADINQDVAKDTDQKTAETFQTMFKKTMESFEGKWQQPEEIADVILEAITASKPHVRYSTNRFMEDFLKQKYVDLTGDSLLQTTTERLKK